MKVYLDYDCVLVDFYKAWCKWINEQLILKGSTLFPARVEDITFWEYLPTRYGDWVNEFWRSPGAYDNHVLPFPGAYEFVDELKKENEVTVVTYSHAEMQDEKERHIIKHFDLPVIHAQYKHLHTKDGVLVDDYRVNIIDHVANNQMPGVLFSYMNFHKWVDDLKHPLIWNMTTYEQVLHYIWKLNERIQNEKASCIYCAGCNRP